DFVSRRFDGLFEAEEFAFHSEIDRAVTALAFDADFVVVFDELWINSKTAWRIENIHTGDFLFRDRGAVDEKFVFEFGFQFATDAEVVVHGQDDDGGVPRAAPLSAAAILDEPIGDGLDEFVLGINGEQRAQGKRGGFDATFGPAPINAVFAPVGGGQNSRGL